MSETNLVYDLAGRIAVGCVSSVRAFPAEDYDHAVTVMLARLRQLALGVETGLTPDEVLRACDIAAAMVKGGLVLGESWKQTPP